MRKIALLAVLALVLAGAGYHVSRISAGAADKAGRGAKSVTGKTAEFRDGPGVYQMKWVVPNPEPKYRDGSLGYARFMESPPAELGQLPRFKSKSPLFGYLDMSTSTGEDWHQLPEMWFALDESGGTGKGYDTLYLDADRNGDMTDDPVHSGKLWTSDSDGSSLNSDRNYAKGTTPGQVETDAAVVEINFYSVLSESFSEFFPASEQKNKVAVDISFPAKGGRIYQGHITYRGIWEGTFDLGKGSVRFRLRDLLGDGMYDSRMETSWLEASGGEILLIHKDGEWHEYRLQQVMNVNNTLCVFTPSPQGDKCRVELYDGPEGRLAFKTTKIGGIPVKPKCDSVSVLRAEYRRKERNEVFVDGYDLPLDGSLISVPAGDYHISDIEFTASAPDKQHWSISYDWGYAGMVEDGKTAYIDLNDKVGMEFTAPAVNNGVVNTTMNLRTAGGLLIIESPDTAEWPVAILRDSSGKEISRGMGHDPGRGMTSFYFTLAAPRNLKAGATCTLDIVFDKSPFGPIKTSVPVKVKAPTR